MVGLVAQICWAAPTVLLKTALLSPYTYTDANISLSNVSPESLTLPGDEYREESR